MAEGDQTVDGGQFVLVEAEKEGLGEEVFFLVGEGLEFWQIGTTNRLGDLLPLGVLLLPPLLLPLILPLPPYIPLYLPDTSTSPLHPDHIHPLILHQPLLIPISPLLQQIHHKAFDANIGASIEGKFLETIL